MLAIAASALSAQDADEIRTYDVRALCAAVAEAEQPGTHPWPIRPLATLAPVRVAITWGEDLERSDGGATITSLVRFALEAVGESATHVTVIPPTLLKVNGPPRAQAAIPAILDELGRVLDRRFDLELSIVSDAASKPTPVSRRRVRAGAEVCSKRSSAGPTSADTSGAWRRDPGRSTLASIASTAGVARSSESTPRRMARSS